MKCPICNAEMEAVKKLVAVGGAVAEPELAKCNNPDCILQPELPLSFRSPAVNALANMLIAVHAEMGELKGKVYTKRRDGMGFAYHKMAKLIEVSLGALGFQVGLSDGE